MEDSLVEHSLDNGILTLTLNRPKRLNSFIEPMAKQLQEALDEANHNPEIRCVLLTGKGKAFSAGQDLPEVVDREESDEKYRLEDTLRTSFNPLIRGIRYLEKPVVCAVNGTATGAGASIAIACDIVLASKDAIFMQAFSKIGLIADSGATFFLPRLVGLQRANALFMLNDKITAEKAVGMGLIYKAVEGEQLMEEARQICTKLAQMPTRAFGLYKRAINQSLQNNLDSQLNLEAELQTEAGMTEDYKEGVQAFLEKREPNFKGK